MAFASIESINPTADSNTGGAATSGNSAAASHSVVLPATVTAGSLLMIFGRVADGTDAITFTGGGWTIVQDDTDASNDRAFYAWRDTLADGTEDGTSVTVNHTSSKMCAVSVSIIDEENPATQAPENSTVAVNTGTTPDPTTCTPTGGAKDYLWLWFGSWSGEQTLSKTQPTDFTDRPDVSTGTGGVPTINCQLKVCDRQLNAASLDPGSITIDVSTPGWTAWTIAIHPPAPVVENPPPIIVAPRR